MNHPNLKLIITDTLDSAQETAIRSLVIRCNQSDGASLSFPFDDAELILYYSNESAPDLTICAAIAFAPVGAEDYECAAFTDPDFRMQGLFSELLEEGLAQIDEDAELYFYTDIVCTGTLAALSKLDAEHLGTEHMLEFPAELLTESHFPGTISTPLTISRITIHEEPTLLYQNEHGCLFIIVRSDSYFLLGLEISESERGQGHGTELVNQVFADLAHRGAKPVRLQVSGDNIPALALYKKAGFRTLETLCCYMY